MSKIPCEMIRDLFPSYIDQLTSDTTNQLIEEHLADCKECNRILDTMQNSQTESVAVKGKEKKEIDFLKKIKKQHTKIIVGSIVAVAAVIGAVLAVRTFVSGDYLYGDWLDCHVIVNGNRVIIEGTSMDDVHGVSQVTFKEENGVVTASTKAVLLSPLHKGDFRAEYTAFTGEVRQVRINDRILWEDNYEITSMASAVYRTRHEYMGDMSANNRTANALGIANYLGSYTNELLTSEEPYTWKLKLSEDIPAEKQLEKESYMESLACIMMAVIDNLDQVTYEYTVDGQALTKNITLEDAENFYGYVKYIDTVRELDELISYTGLSVSDTYYGLHGLDRGYDNTIWINEFIATDDRIKGIRYTIYKDGEVIDKSYRYGKPGLDSGNNGAFGYNKPGNDVYTMFYKGKIGDLTGHTLEIEYTVEDMKGNQYPIKNRVNIPTVYGSKTTVKISGNPKDGFQAEVLGTHYFPAAFENQKEN